MLKNKRANLNLSEPKDILKSVIDYILNNIQKLHITAPIIFIILFSIIHNILLAFLYAILLIILDIAWTGTRYAIKYTYINKSKVLDITIKKLEKEIKEKEIEKEKIDKILDSINPNFKKFLKILEEKGILSVGELEKELIKHSEKVIFIIESGEGTSKILGSENEIYFSRFMEEEFKKRIGDKVEIYRIILPGISSFIVFCNDEKEICPDIDRLYNDIYSGYSKYIDVKFNEDLNKLENKEKRKELEEWYKEFKKDLEDRSRPLILITMPYKISLLSLFKILLSYYSKNKGSEKIEESIENKIPNILEQKINNILSRQINKFGIKFSYLFEAVDFGEEILKQFGELENSIVEELKKLYGIENNSYFYELLHRKDFIERFEELLEKSYNNFYNKIKNDGRMRT